MEEIIPILREGLTRLGLPDADKAAEMLGLSPASCLVVEDAEAGVTAAHRAGMRCVGLGDPAPRAEDTAPSLEGVDWPRLLDGRALA